MSTSTEPVQISINYLPLDLDGRAAEILAAATGSGTTEAGANFLLQSRMDATTFVYGLTVGGELVAVYTLRSIQFMNELSSLAVAEGHRKQGHGRSCLYDALIRSGRKPLVVETDDDGVGFYRHCGFKIVGKRKSPSGAARYRLGWHAPMPKAPGDESGDGVCG